MKTRLYGEEYVFCDEGCKESYREDIRHGLIYGPCVDSKGNQ